jgi:hypothetical protein
MSQFLRRRARNGDEIDANERIAETSADLAYELQSKMFDQLTTVGIGGAGLVVTLIGSVLQNAPNNIWLSVILFGLAAITAISGNQKLVEDLTDHQPCLRRSARDVKIASMLIGMAIGWLSLTVYAQSDRQSSASNSVVAKPTTAPAPAATR